MELERRNLTISDSSIFMASGSKAVWSTFTVNKAVKDGYKISGWVYRAVSMIANSASVVPFIVVDKEGTRMEDHPIDILLQNPHPFLTRKQVSTLIILWLQLAGEGYFKKVKDGASVVEIWPISPDRLAPIVSTETGQMISGYEEKGVRGKTKVSSEYTFDNTFSIRLLDPSNPVTGISPLEVAARAVDLDNNQQDWNASTMQNRGVVDGVFTFDRDLTKEQHSTILSMVKEKFSGILNARAPLVVGSNAKYTRLGLNAIEIDYLNSRKFNREEIFIVYGVPPQLAGVQDSMTYDNFGSADRVFWESTLIPLVVDIADQYNLAFAEELGEDYKVIPDTSNVKALKKGEKEKSEIAKAYYEMDVPMSAINKKLELGIEEYEGWDKPKSSKVQVVDEPKTEGRSVVLIKDEYRSAESDTERKDGFSRNMLQPAVEEMLQEQQLKIFSDVDESGMDDLTWTATPTDKWVETFSDISRVVAADFAGTVVVEERGQKLSMDYRNEDVDAEIEAYLEKEKVILNDLKNINATTADKIIIQVQYAIENDLDVAEFKQALIDTGIFSSARARTIADTTIGTFASIGQVSGARSAGATHKIWTTSLTEVRDIHVKRNKEKVGLDSKFSVQVGSVGPRFPLDPDTDASDRINCRCSMTFE